MQTEFFTTARRGLMCMLVVLVMTAASWAHDTELQLDWCSAAGDQLVSVGQYQLSEQDISGTLSTARTNGPCIIDGIDRSCGQLDHDDYAMARSAAYFQCYAANPLARPVFFGPEEFLNDQPMVGSGTALHHTLYTLDLGVEFGCYICLSSPPRLR